MRDDLVAVFESETLLEAKLASDALEAEGIRCFIDHTESPLDGLVAAEQLHILRVLPDDAERAKQIMGEFESQP